MVVRVVGSARKIKSAPKLGRAERHFRRNMKRENSGKECFWIDLIKTSWAKFFFLKRPIRNGENPILMRALTN